MLLYIHDGTFAGLLSAVFDAYTSKRFPDALLRTNDLPPLITREVHQVAAQPDKAGRVYNGLSRRLGTEALERLQSAFLSGEDGTDDLLFRYIRKIFDTPNFMENDLADNDVLAVLRLARKVQAELHRTLGFVRFQETTQGVYFAPVRPRNNLLPLLVPHFAKRLADRPWILYDLKREYGVHCENGLCSDVHLDAPLTRYLNAHKGRLDATLAADAEPLFQELWRSYCTATSIRERTNPTLQRRCMPLHSREFLTEMYDAPPAPQANLK